jgi:hypothetical protein
METNTYPSLKFWSHTDEQLNIHINTKVRGIIDTNSDTDLYRALLSRRHRLFQRLRETEENPYHNIDHTLDVHDRLALLLRHLRDKDAITHREKLLLLECALRHDDAHSGNRYRQKVVKGWEMSNEEYSAYLMEQDLDGVNGVKPADILFMRNSIHRTSYGQTDPKKLENPEWQRNYKAESLEEKLLVFADVGCILIDGLDAWLRDTEKVQNEIWYEDNIGFLQYVIRYYRSDIREHLDDEIRTRIGSNIQDVEKYIESLTG